MKDYFMYNAIEAFIKINILIVTLYILGGVIVNDIYIFFIGLLGIVWIIFPVIIPIIEDTK